MVVEKTDKPVNCRITCSVHAVFHTTSIITEHSRSDRALHGMTAVGSWRLALARCAVRLFSPIRPFVSACLLYLSARVSATTLLLGQENGGLMVGISVAWPSAGHAARDDSPAVHRLATACQRSCMHACMPKWFLQYPLWGPQRCSRSSKSHMMMSRAGRRGQ